MRFSLITTRERRFERGYAKIECVFTLQTCLLTCMIKSPNPTKVTVRNHTLQVNIKVFTHPRAFTAAV